MEDSAITGKQDELTVGSEPLVLEYRGGHLENVHYGHVCGVNEKSQIAYRTGNPEWVTFMRSAAKPIQAIPFFLENFDDKFEYLRQMSRFLKKINIYTSICFLTSE